MSNRLRLAELLSGLSIVADLGYGLPLETALRSCLIATGLARRMDLPENEIADAHRYMEENRAAGKVVGIPE